MKGLICVSSVFKKQNLRLSVFPSSFLCALGVLFVNFFFYYFKWLKYYKISQTTSVFPPVPERAKPRAGLR